MNPCFLEDKKNIGIESISTLKIGIVSYPRCGNSVIRSLIESMTGITTGSDSRPDRSLIKQLSKMGFNGEGVVDQRVLFVKTHYPDKLGYKSFKIDAAILLIRNPFDAIVSYFNMVLTQSHTNTIEETEYERLLDIWTSFITEESVMYNRFYDFWLHIKSTSKLPILVVKYEDLVQDRKVVLSELKNFVINVLEKHNIEAVSVAKLKERMQIGIESILNTPMKDSSIYTPRESYTKESIFKSLKRYSSFQIKFLVSNTKSVLLKVGYWKMLSELGVVEHIDFFDESSRPRNYFFVVEKPFLINGQYSIRPKTSDDPHGRGFGVRWKRVLSEASPLRIINNPPFDFSMVPS